MRLKSLSCRNFTGTNFDTYFAPISIITGDNGAGKTAIPTAIRLLLTGSLPPPIGVKGIYRYAGNPNQPGEMSISGEMDNGRKVGLKWVRNAKGSVSCEGGIPSDLVMPPLLANPKAFWSKTVAERIQTIFECCPNAGKNLGENIKARLSEVQVMPAKVREEVLAQVLTWIGTLFKEATPQAVCARLLDYSKTNAKSASDEAKSAAVAITAIQLPAEKPKDAGADLTKLRNELVLLRAGQENSAGAHTTGLEQIRLKLEAYSRKYQGTPVEHLIEFLIAEGQTVALDLRRLQVPPPIDDANEELDSEQDEKADLADKLKLAAAQVQTLQAQIGNLEIATECPTCRSSRKDWKEKALKQMGDELTDAKAIFSGLTAKKASCDASVLRLAKEVESISKARVAHTERKAELESEAETLDSDRRNIEDLIREQARVQNKTTDPELPAKIAALTTQVSVLDQQQSLLAGYDRDMAQREKLESVLIQNQATAEVYKAVVKLVTEEQAKASESAFGAVLGVARHFTDGLLNSPLEFVEGDLGRRVSVQDRKRAGFIAPIESWITHETFSDSEQRIAYIGFSVALAAEAPVKLVIIDELATLSDGRKILFVDRLIQLVRKGIIDQAICIEPTGDDYRGFEGEEEVRVIRL